MKYTYSKQHNTENCIVSVFQVTWIFFSLLNFTGAKSVSTLKSAFQKKIPHIPTCLCL